MPTSTQTTTTIRSGLKVKTHVKAGPALTNNHNETLVRPAGARFWSFTLWWLCAGVVFASASAAGAAQLTCPNATTLETLIACIVDHMPGKNTNGYKPPSPQQLVDYRTVVHQMLHGQCDPRLPGSLASNLQRRTFTDSQNGKSYCLLMETELATTGKAVAKGWGTFIVADRADRDISHQVPHPIYEDGTEQQAIELFKLTAAHSFLMCGAHRHANGTDGSCQEGTATQKYGPADCAHNNANMFTMANLELDAFYRASPWTAIQWHGMGTDTCPGVDVYLSQGFNAAPATASTLSLLKQLIAAAQPMWAVRAPGAPGMPVCNKPGTDNVQGRILNGVPYQTACFTDATAPVGDKFIHIEQKDDCPSTSPSITSCRDAAAWSQVVLDTW
jgi:hypothetical protein